MERETARIGQLRRDREDEDQNAHPSDPVAEGPPIEASGRKRFHVGKDRRSRRGETRDDLKQGIDKGGDLPRKAEGEASEKTHQKPGQPDADKPFLRVKLFVGFSAEGEKTERNGDQNADADRKRRKGRTETRGEQGDQKRRDHKNRFQGEDPREDPADHFDVHRFFSFSRLNR